MIFLPPGSAKSTYASVRFPPYYLGRFPRKNIICASYGDSLATSFGRKVRNIIPTREYSALFSTELSQDSQSKGEWETKEGGTYFAVGVGSGVTGRRADLGIIDDPVKSRKEADSDTVKEAAWNWYLSDFLSRIKPGGAQIIIQTRWIEDDLSGRILPEEWSGESGTFKGRDGKTWEVVSIQAQAEQGKNDPLDRDPGEWLWPEWFTPEFWEETKRVQESTDIRNWNSLYQQRPSVEEGTFFKREWFQFYENPPVHLNIYGASDYAVTDGDGDWTEHGVGGVDPLDNLYLIDWWKGQTNADEWIESQLDLIAEHQPLLWVGEAGPIKRSIEPFLLKRMDERRDYCSLDWFASVTDKASRARAFQARAAQGKVFLPNKPWAHELLRQLTRFPGGAHDDGVDVCSLFGRMLDQTYAANLPRAHEKTDNTDAWGRSKSEDGSWKVV